MNRVIVYTMTSALSAFICIALMVSGLVAMLCHWHPALSLIFVAMAFGLVAKFTDRFKMESLYGRTRGDRLHRQRSCHGALMLAHRDLAMYRHRTTGNDSYPPHNHPADPKQATHAGIPHVVKPLLAVMGAVAVMVLLSKQ